MQRSRLSTADPEWQFHEMKEEDALIADRWDEGK